MSTDTTTPAQTPAVPSMGETDRQQRARMPLALDVIEAVAVSHGVCIRPVTLRVTDTLTGEQTHTDVPCGATLEAKCPSCAKRARALRIAQAREGWHLDVDPLPDADDPNEEQRRLMIQRADLTMARDLALGRGDVETAKACSEVIRDLDALIRGAGVRGDIEPSDRPGRRVRSTKRRGDVTDLPAKPMDPTTVGRTFTGRDGTVFRPSLFLTLTLPSYGPVFADGTPRNPAEYDYVRAARDALAFSRLVDRFMQNLRRVAGYDVQYFATVEPQRRLAAHVHIAIRGTIPRALLKQVVAATYHQVWWPTTDEPTYPDNRMPVWDHAAEGFVDPDSGALLPSWDEALDDVEHLADLTGETAQPRHVARFGAQVDVQGLLAGSPEADRRIGYLVKYLTKSITECHDTETAAELAHLDRLAAVLALEPCSPNCANWLRYGITPKNATERTVPGVCKSKAHKRAHLGYAGRRVLVSRQWSGKTLTDHKNDRRAWVLSALGIDPQDDEATNGDKTSDRYVWQTLDPREPMAPLGKRLLRAVSERIRWRAAYDAALAGQPPPPMTPGGSALDLDQADGEAA